MDTPSISSDIEIFTTPKIKRVTKVKKNLPKPPAIEDNKFECLVCENIYESILKLRIHVITDHNGRKVVGKLPFMCKKCGLLYRKRSYLNQHYLKKHPTVHFKGKPQLSYLPVLVEVQKEVVETITKDVPDDFVKVQRTFVEQRYRCDLCNVICKNKAAIRHHKISKHTEQNDWKCLQCSYTTKFKQYYIRHIANKHPETNEVANRSKHICEICGYATHVKGHLEAHSQTHLENKNYMCEICGRRTKTKNAMISHRRMHLKDKKYSCGVDSCQFKTVHLTSLKHHRLSHDPEKNTLHCDKCNFKTFNKYSLKTHIQQHKIGEKIFKCSLCDFATAQNVNLKHHMHKHSKDMKFKCQLCSFTYKYENSLRKHMKKHNTDAHRDNDKEPGNHDVKPNSKKDMKHFKLKQNINSRNSPEKIITEKVDYSTKQDVFKDTLKNDTNRNQDYCDDFLGNYTANYGFNNTVLQCNIHENQSSTEVREDNADDRSYSNHSDNHSNSFVQYNVNEKHDIEERSQNHIKNQNSFVQYNLNGTVEDGNEKYYVNLQNNNNSSTQYNDVDKQANSTMPGCELIDEINHSQFESQNCFIQYNSNNKSNLNDTGGHIVNANQAMYCNQIENRNNATACNIVKHGSNDTVNKNCVNKIEKSFIRYKNCLNRTDSFVQYNVLNNNLINDCNLQSKNQVAFIDYNVRDKNCSSETRNNNFSENSNTDRIRILNQTSNHSASFPKPGSHIDELKNSEMSKNQISDQMQKPTSNSFILYDISDKGGQIELRNDNNSFVPNNDEEKLNRVRHADTPFPEYANNSHCSIEEEFKRCDSDKKHFKEPKNLPDSANAIEIVVNKGVLMMSVDCDAFSSYQNFDYLQD